MALEQTEVWYSIADAFGNFCKNTWVETAQKPGEKTLRIKSGFSDDRGQGLMSDVFAELTGLCAAGKIVGRARLGGSLGPEVTFHRDDWLSLEQVRNSTDPLGRYYSALRVKTAFRNFAAGDVFYDCEFCEVHPASSHLEKLNAHGFNGRETMKDVILVALAELNLDTLDMFLSSRRVAEMAIERAKRISRVSHDFKSKSVENNIVAGRWQECLRRRELAEAYAQLITPGATRLAEHTDDAEVRKSLMDRANLNRRNRALTVRKYTPRELGAATATWATDKLKLT